jgi:hypothetical protein
MLTPNDLMLLARLSRAAPSATKGDIDWERLLAEHPDEVIGLVALICRAPAETIAAQPLGEVVARLNTRLRPFIDEVGQYLAADVLPGVSQMQKVMTEIAAAAMAMTKPKA